MLIRDMDIARMMIHVQRIEADKLRVEKSFKKRRLSYQGTSSGCKRVRLMIHVQKKPQHSVAQGGNGILACTNCDRKHSEV